ncbi:NADH dehydrogenase [ubiquinone] 1 alpha subcomplex subunit 7-like [Osmia bicornis bicornis]|uniref:NADH dehydrogenase [ubiquinone] 1 alpha subcomplex subunit 7-like n=1 Tax=Osmia bicornis bicornis TaxID=1437191 RepID=UPI0010F7FC91|nr:NADH dehydrogenase [ubiquinone] 1 alpha subcomplex subunit 7-like [Osmia bicornis bicornis]
MPGKIEHRSVTPLLAAFRNILRGRRIIEALRFADCLAARTQPPPNIPGGPYHKTSKVYYFTRDARRLVQPPIEVLARKQIGAGKDVSTEIKHCTPGKIYIPDK